MEEKELLRGLELQLLRSTAELIQQAGLNPQEHLRETDDGFVFTHQALNVIHNSQDPPFKDHVGRESLEGVGLKRPFRHPLSQMDSNTGGLNYWMVSSILLNSALGWDETADARVAIANLHLLLPQGFDVHSALTLAKYSDPELLRICNEVYAALEAGGVNRMIARG